MSMTVDDERSQKRRDLKGDARRGRILAMLQSRPTGDLSVEELSEKLDVSLATVRRDLNRMRELGTIARTYGGVALMRSVEVPVRDRQTSHRAAKTAIGRLAAELVSPGDLIIVDAGTTTARFAACLGDLDDLTVVTNGIGVINSVLDGAHPGPDVIVLGGQLRSINETIVGAVAQEMLTGVRASRAFIGTDAIDPQHGIASRTFSQSILKKQMMASSSEIVILADSSKLGGGDFSHWTPLTRSWTLVTDADADEHALERARLAGATDIRIAEIADARHP